MSKQKDYIMGELAKENDTLRKQLAEAQEFADKTQNANVLFQAELQQAQERIAELEKLLDKLASNWRLLEQADLQRKP